MRLDSHQLDGSRVGCSTLPRAFGLVFFISGAAGLLYEVVWVRKLGLILGSEAVASQAVLAAYFVGMAAGAGVLGRRIDQASSALRSYAYLEGAVAAAGVYSLAALELLDRVVPLLTTGQSGPELCALAFAAALMAFLPATFFMGATLPALVVGLTGALAEAPRVLGRLYALNTLGAVAGALVTGFALLAVIGSQATILLAAGLNAAAAAAAGWLAKPTGTRVDEAAGPTDQARLREPVTEIVNGPEVSQPRVRILTVLALAGFAAMAFEIAAIRVLAVTLESTVYSFSATLGSYLLGIVVASAAYARWPITTTSSRGRCALLVGGAAMALGLVAQLLRVSGPLHASLSTALGDTWRGRLAAEVMTSLLIVLPAAIPPTLLFCALAPLVVSKRDRAAGELGAAYMANTLGCAVAPLLAALVLLPLDGSRGALRAAAAALVVATLVLRQGAGLAPVGLSGLGLLLALALPPRLYTWPLTEGRQVLYSHEGPAGAVAVEGRGKSRVLRTGGRYFEGGSASVFAERRQGHLPMLLHPSPRRALVLGIGTGTTLGAVGAHPDVGVDGVELLDEVLDALPWFNGTNGGLLDNPAIRLHQADARAFVRAAAGTGCRYDVIVADLFHPQQSGVGNLYTREHFAAVRSALAPRGLFMQWLPLYELPPEALATVVRTFLDVFPFASGWYAHFNATTGILGLLGSEASPGLDWDAALSRITDPALSHLLSPVLLDRPMEFLGSLVADRTGLQKLAAGSGPLNTDDRPVLEYAVPRGHSPSNMTVQLRSLDAVLAVREMPGEQLLRLGADPVTALAHQSSLAIHQEAIDKVIRGQRAAALGDLAGAAAAWKAGLRAAPDFKVNYALLLNLAAQMARAGRAGEAETLLKSLMEIAPENTEAEALLDRIQLRRAR